ncbi:MAG TPA: hypothetical protein VIM98_07370 [Dyella sp.]|uniref:hypothetical protein n=1 Tax=Dyella sp. TaxID=1869338 RepID=UPI002F938FD9
MELLKFNPENELEVAIVSAKRGGLSLPDLMKKFTQSDVYISSKREVTQDGSGFDPLLVGSPENPLVAAFSSLSRPSLHAKMAAYVLRMKGREFLHRLPQGYGVAFNPGYEAQLIISSDVISDLKKI